MSLWSALMSGPVAPHPVREGGRRLFGLDPAGYDAASTAVSGAGVRGLARAFAPDRSARVLEIGPGTGLATREVANLGVAPLSPSSPIWRWPSHPARPGRGQTTTTRRGRRSPSRRPTCRTGEFDLAYAATSFHWIDPDVGLAKVHSLLARVACGRMFWNVFGDPDRLDPSMKPPARPGAAGGQARRVRGPGRFSVSTSIATLGARRPRRSSRSRRSSCRDARPRQRRDSSALWDVLRDQPARALDRRDRLLDELVRIAEQEFDDRVERNLVTAVYTARAPAPELVTGPSVRPAARV